MLNRALLTCVGTTLLAGGAVAQQTTDVSLIGNKDWGSGGNPGFILTFDKDQTWKINSSDGSKDGEGDAIRTDTSWNAYSQDTWNLVIGVFDRTSGTISTYQNGALIETDTVDYTGSVDTFGSALDLNVGQDGTGNYAGGQGFIGYVDEVSVWRRALSGDEIGFIYDQAINSSNNLAAITGSNGGGPGLIGDNLVGYYDFEGNADDTSGSANINNGFWNGNEQYVADQFGGQAANLDGASYVTIGDDTAFPGDYTFGDEATGTDFSFMAWTYELAPPPPPEGNFTGNTPGNNNASDAGNWDVAPASWDSEFLVTVADGTNAEDPAVFDGAFGSQTVKKVVFGADGSTTDIEMNGGSELIASGNENSYLGDTNSILNLTLNGDATINHVGEAEEGSQLDIARAGSTVNLVMNDDSVVASGTFEKDSSYATGYRRPLTTDAPAQTRLGDDIDLGNGGDLNVVMNGESLIYTPDVFYPHDSSTEADVTVVQNDDSKVVVGWDTRFFDTGGPDEDTGNRSITWTLNNNSQFLVARDHGLGEAGIDGSITININDNALFYAGGRIAAGAGFDGDVEINQTGGRLQAGSAIGDPGGGGALTVDGTGVDATGTVIDGVLWMGEGARSVVYNLNGGSADITRTAFIGADGAATVNQTGGVFTIYGTGATGDRDGNDTVGIPVTTWTDGGGELFLARIEGDTGTYNLSGGTLNVARDLRAGFSSSDEENVLGGTGIVNISGTGNLDVGQILAIGNAGNGTLSVEGPDAVIEAGVLAFGGLGGTAPGSGLYEAIFTSVDHSVVNVVGVDGLNDGDVFLTDAVISADFAEGFDPFAAGSLEGPAALATASSEDMYEWQIIDFAGTRIGEFALAEGMDDGSLNGYIWDVRYDDANGDIFLQAMLDILLGDVNSDGVVDGLDIDPFVTLVTDGGFDPAADMNRDGVIDGLDINPFVDAVTGVSGDSLELSALTAVPEPSSALLLGLGGLAVIRRRRA